MWNLSGVGVVFSLLQFSFYIPCNSGNRRFPVKIAYLSERKVKFFMKRVRENSLELHTGLHCGLWADASATLSSVQGVNSQPGMAVFAATLISGAVWVVTAALPHLPKLQWCYRLWEKMKFFQWSRTWFKKHLWDSPCLKCTRLHVLGPGHERLKHWRCMPNFVFQSVSEKLWRGSHTAGFFRHTVTLGTVLENSPLQQQSVAGYFVSTFLQEARRDMQVSGKVMEQEKGTLILLQK